MFLYERYKKVIQSILLIDYSKIICIQNEPLSCANQLKIILLL